MIILTRRWGRYSGVRLTQIGIRFIWHDTKKAERYFKERRIPYQAIDLLRYGMSRGELTSVKNAVGLEALLNPKAADYALVQHLAYEQDKIERLLEDPSLLQTPIVRNGRQATVGYCPDVWKTWE